MQKTFRYISDVPFESSWVNWRNMNLKGENFEILQVNSESLDDLLDYFKILEFPYVNGELGELFNVPPSEFSAVMHQDIVRTPLWRYNFFNSSRKREKSQTVLIDDQFFYENPFFVNNLVNYISSLEVNGFLTSSTYDSFKVTAGISQEMREDLKSGKIMRRATLGDFDSIRNLCSYSAHFLKGMPGVDFYMENVINYVKENGDERSLIEDWQQPKVLIVDNITTFHGRYGARPENDTLSRTWLVQ